MSKYCETIIYLKAGKRNVQLNRKRDKIRWYTNCQPNTSAYFDNYVCINKPEKIKWKELWEEIPVDNDNKVSFLKFLRVIVVCFEEQVM